MALNEEKARALKARLRAEIKGKDWPKERKDAYVFGTLRKLGWKPRNQ